MELLPTSADHDIVTERVRQFAATRLTELIMSLQPFVNEALRDPSDIIDVEPARIQANVSLIKLQLQMVKQLGDLYQVTKPPREHVDPNLVPMQQVEALLQAERDAADARVLEAAAAAAEAVRTEMLLQQRLSLEAARSNVTAALQRLS